MPKTLIITQQQLEEVVGGNSAYLDGVGSPYSDTIDYDGHNSVYSNGIKGQPITGDKLAKQIRQNSNYWMNSTKIGSPITCSKEEFEKMVIDEDNSGLRNINMNSVVYHDGTPVKNITGNESKLAMRKTRAAQNGNTDEYNAVTNTLNKQRANAKRQKKFEKDVLGKPMIAPHTRQSGNGQAHKKKNNNIINNI